MPKLLIALVCALLSQSLQARHALLVGISDYQPPITPLEGPRNDVHAVQRALIKHWQFPADNIRVLLDSQATKAEILAAITQLENITEPGEDVFIYLSGHGTSAMDRGQGLPLPTTSGAYVPFDMGRPTSLQQAASRLLVGRTDLNPLLRRLDAGGRNVFVVIDACYSGNTVRSAFGSAALVNRYVDLDAVLPPRAFGDDVGGGDFGTNTIEQQTYPYKNVFYLGASGEHEVAQDIPSHMLGRMPTVDGKPHGAFTDAFLRVMMGQVPADEDGDGFLSYGEVYQGLRSFMGQRPYTHTPTRLPSLSDDGSNLASRSLFGEPTPSSHPPARGEFTVHVENFDALARQLKESGIALTERDATLTVRPSGDSVLLLGPSADLVTEISGTDEAKVLDAVLTQKIIHDWVNKKLQSGFSLFADLQGVGAGSTRVQGDVLGFSLRAGKAAYAVVLNIGPTGNVTVLYPYSEAEKVTLPAAQLMALNNLATVAPPFGREIIDFYAFGDWPEKLTRFMGKTLPIGSNEARELLRILHGEDKNGARTTLAVYTVSGR